MRKLWLLVILSLPCSAQVGNGIWQFVWSAPSGSCSQSAQPQLVMGPGTLYTCQTGTWAIASGGGAGSGTVNPGTASQIAYYPSTAAAVSGDPALTDSGTILNYTGTMDAVAFAATGAFAGQVSLGAGTAQGTVANSFSWMAPTSIPTGYNWIMPSADCNGLFNVSSDVVTCVAQSGLTNVVYKNAANAFTSAGTVDLTLAAPTNGFLLPAPGGSCGAVVAGALCHNGNNYIGSIGGSPNAFLFAGTITNNTIPKFTSSTLAQSANSSITDDGTTVSTGEPINSTVGFRIATAAPSGHYPRGNGTNYVDGTIAAADLPTQLGCPYGGTTAGSAAAQTLTVPNIPAAATAGTCISFTAGFTGTSSTTLTITPTGGSAYAAINLFKRITSGVAALGAADEVANGVYQAIYDGTQWVLLTSSGTVYAAGALTSGSFLRGNSNNNAQTSSGVNSSNGTNITTYGSIATAGAGVIPVRAVISLTAQSAAISTATLCAAANCGNGTAGEYNIDAYIDSTVTCATPGPAVVGLTLTWTDEIGTKSAQTVPIDVNGATSLTTTMALGNTTNFASGHATIWTTGTIIQYATTYTACTSGTGTYAIRIAVSNVQ